MTHLVERTRIAASLDAVHETLHYAGQALAALEKTSGRDFDEATGALELALGFVERASASIRAQPITDAQRAEAQAQDNRLRAFLDSSLRAQHQADHDLRRGEGPDTTLRVKPCPRCGLSVETRWYPHHAGRCKSSCDHGQNETHTCEHGVPCKKVAPIEGHCPKCQAGWRGAL